MIRDEHLQLEKRLQQAAVRCDRTGFPQSCRFIGTEDIPTARHFAKEYGLTVAFDGGWPEAERVQPCYYFSGDEPVFTRVWVKIGWNSRFSSVRHHDLMGSLMALGMDRSLFGDLIWAEDKAWLCTLPEMAERLPLEWTAAGNTPITITTVDGDPEIQAPAGVLLRDTVPSLRLDCVLSSGMKLSRAKAAEVIRQGIVSLNHRPETGTDRQLSPGDLLSIRHFGRIRLKEVGDPTRKDRLPIVLEIFTR